MSNGKLLRVKFGCYRNKFGFIIDSGASCSIISSNLVPKGVIINTAETITITGINGKSRSLGTIKTSITYKHYKFNTILHVAENLPESVPALIGTDFLRYYRANINLQNMTLELMHENSHITIPFEINQRSMLTIPARTEILTCIPTNERKECVVLNKQISPFVFVANSIATPKDGKIPIRIVNVANKPICIDSLKVETKRLKDFNIIGKIEAPRHDANRSEQLLKELNLEHLSSKDKATITKLCLKYADVFCLKNDKLTTTSMYTSSIKLKSGTTPVYSKQYRLPQSQKVEINKQIDNMMESSRRLAQSGTVRFF